MRENKPQPFWASLSALLLIMAGLGLLPITGRSEDNRAAFTTPTMPYQAFERLSGKSTLTLPDARLTIGYAPGALAIDKQQFENWLKERAKIVAAYYGRFPVKAAKILIVPARGRGIKGGQAFGYRGGAIRLYLGQQTTIRDLENDWVAIHEMIHLALPSVAERHYWLSEGIAVYVESIARVQAGNLKEETIWQDFMRDMPKGLPQAGDRGLDHTPSWGRRYWGGALFCLLLDIAIREQTDNRLGLQQALRGVQQAGGSMLQFWSIDQIIDAADASTGKTAFQSLYQQMRATPVTPDLSSVWARLGVISKSGRITLDETAPNAALRRAILTPLP